MALVQTLLGIAYPVFVYLALSVMQPRAVALIVLGTLALRVLALGRERRTAHARAIWAPLAAAGSVALLAVALDSELGLLLGPAGISFALGAVFAFSLVRGTPVIERFARLQVPDLGAGEVAYCRRVTQVWCAFFALNGTIALALALAADRATWAVYTGLVAYVAMGALFALEYVYRHSRFRRYVGGPFDPLLRRLFPPPPAPPGVHRLAPTWLAERASADGWERDLEIPRDLACWPGHFEGIPLVPGVLQLRWVMELIETHTREPIDVSALEALKFHKPLRPGARVTLAVSPSAASTGFTFRFARGDEVFASGRILSTPPMSAGTCP